MKISTDTYMMMQATLMANVASTIKDNFVNPEYVKIHIDKLLKVNGCEVIDRSGDIPQCLNEIQGSLMDMRDRLQDMHKLMGCMNVLY